MLDHDGIHYARIVWTQAVCFNANPNHQGELNWDCTASDILTQVPWVR